MRILLYIRHAKGRVFHDLAQLIHKQCPDAVFGAHVLYQKYNEDFLRKQTDLSYEKIYSNDDVFRRYHESVYSEDKIKAFEAKYSELPGWMHLCADRDIMPYTHYRMGYKDYNHEECLRWVMAIAEQTEDMLNDFEPDMYLDFSTVSAQRSIAKTICKARGIPYMVPVPSRFKDFYALNDEGCDRWPELESWYAQRRWDSDFEPCRGMELLEEFCAKQLSPPHIIPQQRKMKEERLRFVLWQRVKQFKGWVKRRFQKQCKKAYAGYREHVSLPWNVLWRDLTRDWRRLRIQFKSPFQREVDFATDYCFYPMHVIPESSTGVDAPYFMNELTIIEALSKSMPLHMKLYVKEHLPMLYHRPISFYKHVSRIPNVVLLDPQIESALCIQNSQCVSTISGTAGLEAVLYGKPALLFGRSWYSYFGLVQYESDVTKLPQFFYNLSQHKPKTRDAALLLEGIEQMGYRFVHGVVWNPDLVEDKEESYRMSLENLSRAILKRLKPSYQSP